MVTTELSEGRDELVDDTSLGHQPPDLEDLRRTCTSPEAAETMTQEEVHDGGIIAEVREAPLSEGVGRMIETEEASEAMTLGHAQVVGIASPYQGEMVNDNVGTVIEVEQK